MTKRKSLIQSHHVDKLASVYAFSLLIGKSEVLTFGSSDLRHMNFEPLRPTEARKLRTELLESGYLSFNEKYMITDLAFKEVSTRVAYKAPDLTKGLSLTGLTECDISGVNPPTWTSDRLSDEDRVWIAAHPDDYRFKTGSAGFYQNASPAVYGLVSTFDRDIFVYNDEFEAHILKARFEARVRYVMQGNFLTGLLRQGLIDARARAVLQRVSFSNDPTKWLSELNTKAAAVKKQIEELENQLECLQAASTALAFKGEDKFLTEYEREAREGVAVAFAKEGLKC